MTNASQPETIARGSRFARHPPQHARLVLVSMNPKAGTGNRQKHVVKIVHGLENAGFTVKQTSDLSELRAMAAAGDAAGELRVVLAVGGDGTASTVRNNVPLEVPILNIPMGTENLLGRFLGQSTTPDSVCRTVEHGVVVSLDLGKAGDKVFLLMISAGFDAEVIRALHEGRRGNIRRSAYFLPTLKAVTGYAYPHLRLYSGADYASSTPQLCRWVFGFNLPLYALGLPICADAVATDGLLDVCTFERGRIWNVARYLLQVVRRVHHTLPDAGLSRMGRFRLEPTTSASVAYQIDGDFGGTLPVDVEVLPGQLKLLVTPEAAVRLGFTIEP